MPTDTSRRTLRFLAVAAALALCSGCGDGAQRGGGFQMPPLPVETTRVVTIDLVDRFAAVGSVLADESVTVVAEIDGIVIELPFREGEAIAAGALIARLDDTELAAQVTRAAAVRDQRQVAHARIARIVGQGAGAPQDLDDAVAALAVAEAELDLARARLAKTRIAAPFAGITGRRLVSPGAFLRSGTAITELAAVDRLRINFAVPERLLARLAADQRVQVTTTAYPDLTISGTVTVVDPGLDPATRNASILARVENPDGRLRPGMSADVEVVLAVRRGALAVPAEAVFAQGGRMLVFEVLPDSSVVRRTVLLGLRQRDLVEIVDGLTAGVRVVRAGHQKLFDGARVLPIADDADDTEAGATAGGGV